MINERNHVLGKTRSTKDGDDDDDATMDVSWTELLFLVYYYFHSLNIYSKMQIRRGVPY